MAENATCGSLGYTVSKLAKELNQFPHYDRFLHSVPNEFDPTDTTYIQGVGFSAALFLLIGFILMLFVLVYLCARACCCTGEDDESEKKQGCNPIFMFIVMLLCGGGLVLGYYGNEFTRTGITGAADALINISTTVSTANTTSSSLTGNLTTSGNRLDQLSTEFRNEMQLPPSERTRLASEAADARDAVRSSSTQSEEIGSTINNIPDLKMYAELGKKYDDWRWKGTIGALCFVVFILLVAILCAICRSICFLQFNVFLALIAILVSWLAGGVFVAVGVIAGDFCVNPERFIDDNVNNNTLPTIIYFTRCGDCTNPFGDQYGDGRRELVAGIEMVDNLHNQTLEYNLTRQANLLVTLNQSLGSALLSLDTLILRDVNCTRVNGDYNLLLSSFCDKTLDGAVFSMSGCFVLGVTLILLIIAMQLFWTRIRDECDDDYGGESIPMKRRFNQY